MTTEELLKLVEQVRTLKSELQTVEVKAAEYGCPQSLYGTLSSFSNQDEGGIILFGLDEKKEFAVSGVYDAHDLQQRVKDQCLEMEPPVRAVFTVVQLADKAVVGAEIPAVNLEERPCYYKGKGRSSGSFVRVGDADMRMTDYEIYSYEAFRKKYQDDIRVVPEAEFTQLDQTALSFYIASLKKDKPNLAALPNEDIYKLMSLEKQTGITLAAAVLFGVYPQAYFPQLCLTAIVVPGNEVGEIAQNGARFIDNKRIEGTLPQILEGALRFVRSNMKVSVTIDPYTAQRQDCPEYPLEAVREMVLNALVHRDYSLHTEGKPIQLIMYADRLEVHNPGGLYGRLKVDELGKVQPDTRNPVLAAAMEHLGLVENRYSGIPTIRRVVREAGLPEPVFQADRETFKVVLYKRPPADRVAEAPARQYGYGFNWGGAPRQAQTGPTDKGELDEKEALLIEFCREPRTRAEIATRVGLKSESYAVKRYAKPLIEKGYLRYEYPDSPGSPYQRFVTV